MISRVKKPPIVAKIVTPIVVLLVMLVLVEIFLQVFMRLPFSDRLYWISDGHVKARLEPNQKVVNTDGNSLNINRFGFRGAEWEWKPSPGTLRVITLGGSSTFCFQVSDDENTWPAQLEKMLRKRLDMPVEVLNLALSGYDASNSKINYLFYGRALHPHVALVYHTWNDLKFLRPIEDTEDGGMPSSALSGRPSTGVNQSALARVFRRLQIVRRFDLVLTKMKDVKRENSYTSMEEQGSKAHGPVGERAWKWFEKNFDDIASFAKSDGVMPVLISQATLARKENINNRKYRLQISNNYVGMTIPRLADSYAKAGRIIENVAKRQGALFVNGYDAVPSDLTHMKDHVHLLDPGTKRLAEEIAGKLVNDEAFMQVVQRVRAR